MDNVEIHSSSAWCIAIQTRHNTVVSAGPLRSRQGLPLEHLYCTAFLCLKAIINMVCRENSKLNVSHLYFVFVYQSQVLPLPLDLHACNAVHSRDCERFVCA
jgi:hypothetical protein